MMNKMCAGIKYKVYLIQQSVWSQKLQTVPLAMAYLKAYSQCNTFIMDHFDIQICNFNSSHSNKYIIDFLFKDAIPDILCLSIQGWNINNFTNICKYYKSIMPNGKILIGGAHVSNQASKVFSLIPEVDIISNGEGEMTFLNLLLNYYDFTWDKKSLHSIRGISFIYNEHIVTTERQEPIASLDVIPSPYLNNIISFYDDGKEIYDAAMIETSRGCPFACSYCSWAEMGIKGIRHFSLERLNKELLYFAKNKVKNIVLCDSNFGLYKSDERFIDLLIEINRKYHYPTNIECSWASGIPKTTMIIWGKLAAAGIKNNFSFALQSLNKVVLRNINRNNVSWEHLKSVNEWTKSHGIDYFIELIWGLPGETIESFVCNINKLATLTKRFAVYPLIILPKSDLMEKKQEFEIKTIKESDNDFEYVVSNYSLSQSDNFKFTKYIFWVRLLSENMLFRHIWDILLHTLSNNFFDIIISFTNYILQNSSNDKFDMTIKDFTLQCDLHNKIPQTLVYIYENIDSFKKLVFAWWDCCIISAVSVECKSYIQELIRYEMCTLPQLYFNDGKYEEENGVLYYVSENMVFEYDFIQCIEEYDIMKIKPSLVVYDIKYKLGFENYLLNQEFIYQYVGIAKYSTISE